MSTLNTAKFFTKAVDLSATSGGSSADVIYTCPNNFIALIRFMHVSNGSSNNKKYTLQWYEASSTTYHLIVDARSLSANSLEEVIQGGGYLALAAGDKIVGFEDSGSDFHIVLSGEEHFQPTSA